MESARSAAASARRDEDAATLALVKRIVGGVDREHPADGVLRTVLKQERGLRRERAGDVARMVFGYFRWRGFVGRGLPLERQIQATVDWGRRFAADPSTIPTDSLERAVPGWVRDRVGGGAAWWAALQAEPALWLRARPGTAEAVRLALGEAVQPWERLVPDAVRYEGEKDLFREASFQAGAYEIQDLASQMVGVACAPKAGETWWDACAGEGGKALHLADLMGNRGVVWATDSAEWRLKRLRIRAARAGLFNLRWARWAGDGSGKPPGLGRFDGVLVDAPCSGLGTWQRNPHARWATTLDDANELALLQERLVRDAARGVKPGGRLVYSVCTLTHEETERLADRFEAEQGDHFVASPLPDEFRRGSGRRTRGERSNRLWIWPQDWGGNGMYIAAWTRRSA